MAFNLSSSKEHLPYIIRLITFTLFITPSMIPLLNSFLIAFFTASISLSTALTKVFSSRMLYLFTSESQFSSFDSSRRNNRDRLHFWYNLYYWICEVAIFAGARSRMRALRDDRIVRNQFFSL